MVISRPTCVATLCQINCKATWTRSTATQAAWPSGTSTGTWAASLTQVCRIKMSTICWLRLPLSHHPWAGDLHHGATPGGMGEQASSNPNFLGGSATQPLPSQTSGQGQPGAEGTLTGIAYSNQGQDMNEAMLRQVRERSSSSSKDNDNSSRSSRRTSSMLRAICRSFECTIRRY